MGWRKFCFPLIQRYDDGVNNDLLINNKQCFNSYFSSDVYNVYWMQTFTSFDWLCELKSQLGLGTTLSIRSKVSIPSTLDLNVTLPVTNHQTQYLTVHSGFISYFRLAQKSEFELASCSLLQKSWSWLLYEIMDLQPWTSARLVWGNIL